MIEGDAGSVTATFTVSLNTPSGRGVTVDVASANGTATSPADYTALPLTTLAFAAGETTKTVTVDVHGDVLDEFDETYTLALSNQTNATIADNLGLGTITDDDALPTLSIDDVTVAEGNSGTVAATFTVGLSAPSGRAVSADYATANGTATAPGDYSATSGELTFAVGETTKTITVLVNGDLFDELDETYAVNLTNVVNAAAPDPQGLGTISDDDGLPSVSVSDVIVTEGSGSSNAVFTLSLNAPSGQPVDVDYVTADGIGHGAGRLHGLAADDDHLRPGSGDADGLGGDRGRPARRDRRELHAQPLERRQRDDLRPAGARHDHRQRPDADPLGRRRHRHRG